MRSSPVRHLALDCEESFTHHASSYLALIDLETYPGFVGERADDLDLMAHLQRQARALTVIAWKVSQPLSRIHFTLLSERRPLAEVMPSGLQPFATGWIRTFFGRLAFADNELLEACARDRARDFRHGHAGNASPHIFEVPPGTYAASVFAITQPEQTASPLDPGDFVVLRHYAFPPPRVAPIRLGGFTPTSGPPM